MIGPASYANWRRQREGADYSGGYEAAIFTDAHITGMITEGYGPYQFLNTISMREEAGVARPAIVARVELYGTFEMPEFPKTTEAGYHAGWLDDELAALLSLCLGIRAYAGERTRQFGKNDARGFPCAHGLRPDPVIPPFQERGSVLPYAIGEHCLDQLKPFEDFFRLRSEAAISLIRAARLFHQAMWIAESDQNLAWIMFSSAVETAANQWRDVDDPPADRLRAWNAKLAEKLSEVGGPAFMDEVAGVIAPVTGATKKFLDFLQEFRPEPPSKRPPAAFQMDWSSKALKLAFKKVYAYRSRALHAGIPFPSPMGWAPMRIDGASAEKMVGGAGTGVHRWDADELPLHLHTYEYIVRGSLLNWWKQLPRE